MNDTINVLRFEKQECYLESVTLVYEKHIEE